MSKDATDVGIAAVLDAMSLMQGQLDAIMRANARIEAAQKEMFSRLDTIDAGQAAVTDLTPVLEIILARSIEDRKLTQAQFTTIAEIAARAYYAAKGNPAPLPVNVADSSLLEQFALTQPPDRTSTNRALVEWQKIASGASTTELVDLLARQYQPSPTETADTRVLRYQLAAITRAEIEGRGATPPPPPATIETPDRSTDAKVARSEDLAQLWRAGETTALYAEPELAGALDLFADAERREGTVSEEQLSAELASLHRDLAGRLEAGDHPSIADARPVQADERANDIQPDLER